MNNQRQVIKICIYISETDESAGLAECKKKGNSGWFKYAFHVVSGVSIVVIGGVILYFFGFS